DLPLIIVMKPACEAVMPEMSELARASADLARCHMEKVSRLRNPLVMCPKTAIDYYLQLAAAKAPVFRPTRALLLKGRHHSWGNGTRSALCHQIRPDFGSDSRRTHAPLRAVLHVTQIVLSIQPRTARPWIRIWRLELMPIAVYPFQIGLAGNARPDRAFIGRRYNSGRSAAVLGKHVLAG